MRFFRGELKFTVDDIKKYGDNLTLIIEMMEQVEQLKANVKVQQILNDRILEIINEISDNLC